MTTFKYWLPEKYAQDMETYWPLIFIIISIYFMLRKIGIKKIADYLIKEVIILGTMALILTVAFLSIKGYVDQLWSMDKLSGNLYYVFSFVIHQTYKEHTTIIDNTIKKYSQQRSVKFHE